MTTSTTPTAPLRVPAARLRAGAVTLILGMALFGLGQVVHGPEVSPTRDLDEYVAAMSTPRLAAAHLILALAATLLLVGSAAIYALLAARRSERTALAAFLTTTAGAALVVLGLGAAALAYPDLATAHGQDPDLITPLLEGGMRVLAVVFTGGGLLVLAGVLTATAVWRSDWLPRRAGIPYALALPLVLATENAPTWTKALVAVAITAAAWRLGAAMWAAADDPARERTSARPQGQHHRVEA